MLYIIQLFKHTEPFLNRSLTLWLDGWFGNDNSKKEKSHFSSRWPDANGLQSEKAGTTSFSYPLTFLRKMSLHMTVCFAFDNSFGFFAFV